MTIVLGLLSAYIVFAVLGAVILGMSETGYFATRPNNILEAFMFVWLLTVFAPVGYVTYHLIRVFRKLT